MIMHTGGNIFTLEYSRVGASFPGPGLVMCKHGKNVSATCTAISKMIVLQ